MNESKTPVSPSGRREKASSKPTPTPRTRRKTDSATTITAEERVRMIETAAYYRAERRGFTAGHEADDWLAAEAEIEALIASARSNSSRPGSSPGRSRKPRSN